MHHTHNARNKYHRQEQKLKNSGNQLRRRRCYFTLILQIIRLLPKQIDRKQIDLFSFDLFHVYFAVQIRLCVVVFSAVLFFPTRYAFFRDLPFSRESRS